MTTDQMLLDAHLRPDLIGWNGRMSAASFQRWLDENPWAKMCPSDLMALWAETGGGDLFETETILGPPSNPDRGDDLKATNDALRSVGMAEHYLVFHIGLFTSAVDMRTREYVELEDLDFHVVRRFPTLDDWYRMTLRHEYGPRYGLP